MGVYALILNPIFSSLLIFVISYLKYPLKFSIRFPFQPLRPLFSYSIFQFLFNIINYFSRNSDTLLIGKYLGMVPLGFYDKSYRLMSLPLQNITQVITPVIHPILSQKGKDKDYLCEANLKLTNLLALIGFPLSIFLFFSAEELILMFFGPQWELAIPSFKILSPTVGIQLVLSSSGSIFQTAGDTKSLFICGLFSAILNVGGIIFGVFYFKSIEAVSICLLITFAINFIQTYWLMYKIIFMQSILGFINILWKPILFTLLLAVIFYIFTSYYSLSSLPIRLTLKICIYLFFMGFMIWFGGYRNLLLVFLRKSSVQ